MKTNPLLKFVIAAVALFEIGITASSYALVPVSWGDASADNTWENALNWVPALEPTNNTFDVEIGLVSTAPCNLAGSSDFQIDALTLSNSAAHLNLIPGALLAFTNTVTNNGTIVVNTTGANTTTSLRFDTSLLITGNGNIRLNGFGSGFNYADFNLNGQTVTIGINQTLHGHGTILGNGILINNGTINGDDASGNNMQVDLVNNAGFTNQNNGFMKATNGGVLGLYSGLVDQTGGGTFLADGANSIVQLGGGGFAVVEGGILNTLNNGLIEATGAGVALVSCTNNGAFVISPNNLAVIGGSYGAFGPGTGLTNNGKITVGDGTLVNTSKLRFDSSGTLSGTGDVLLKGVTTNFNYADFDLNGQTVTIGANQTLHGLGTILGNGILINNGLIAADDSTGNMQVDLVNNAGFTNQNNGFMKATNGGVLGLYSGLVDQTGGGTFLADGANSIVQLGGGGFAVVEGGILNTLNNGLIEANGSGVGLVSCTNNGAFLIPSGNLAVIGGSYGAFGSGTGLTNNGRVTVGDGTLVNTTKLRFDSSGTLSGTGDVLLKGVTTNFNVADLDLNSQTVTIGPSQTLHGIGTVLGISGILINNGLIAADDATGSMQLDLVNNASFINQNNATIKAINGSVLGLYSGLVDQTGGGTFLADGANSIVQLGGGGFAIVVGGILNTTNNGIIQVTPGGAGVGLTSVTNNGTVQIPGGEIIVVTGTGLTNNGTVLVDTNADNSTTKIRFDADGTLGGNGSVTLNGILGSYNVADFDCNGHSVINDVNHTIKGNGDIFMNGGTLTNNGIIAPGLSPGQLNINGDLELGSTSNLSFEIGGTGQGTTYDLLDKIDSGTLTLNGNLTVRLINGFTPANSDVFTVVTTQQILAGAFTNVANGGRLNTADGGGSFQVTYNVLNDPLASRNVILSNFQPTVQTRPELNGSGSIQRSKKSQAQFLIRDVETEKEGPQEQTPWPYYEGTFIYSDSKSRLNFTSTRLTNVSINSNRATFGGIGQTTGKHSKTFTFTVTVTANQQPATNDTFSIATSTGYAASGNIVSGSITITPSTEP
jgi:fibronectin-binding autotransporter adhesin